MLVNKQLTLMVNIQIVFTCFKTFLEIFSLAEDIESAQACLFVNSFLLNYWTILMELISFKEKQIFLFYGIHKINDYAIFYFN